MTALTDHFDTIHKKDIKNKAGQVVAQVDYVSWSQVADRLDAASPGWSFSVVQLGDDWCLGRLNLGDGRGFENIGYAENADMDWKKEPLKDAVSDAFKRCAALAGVARYLYDKDIPQGRSGGLPPSAAVTRPVQVPRPAPPPGGAPQEPEYLADAFQEPLERPQTPVGHDGGTCPAHPDRAWTNGKYGWYCTGKAVEGYKSNARGYCAEKPTPKWVALQEVAS